MKLSITNELHLAHTDYVKVLFQKSEGMSIYTCTFLPITGSNLFVRDKQVKERSVKRRLLY